MAQAHDMKSLFNDGYALRMVEDHLDLLQRHFDNLRGGDHTRQELKLLCAGNTNLEQFKKNLASWKKVKV